MVRKNGEEKHPACVSTIAVKNKQNCDCCGRAIYKFRPCGPTSSNSSCQQEPPESCVTENSDCQSSSTSCDCKEEKKCVRVVERICKESEKIEKCIRDFETEAYQNGITPNVCKKPQVPCLPRWKSTNEDICRTCSPVAEVCQNGTRPNVCKKPQDPCSCAWNSASGDVYRTCSPVVCQTSPRANVCKKPQDPRSCACNSASEDVCRTCSPVAEVCQNDTKPNVCKKPQDPRSCACNSPSEDVCRTCSPLAEVCQTDTRPNVCKKPQNPYTCAWDSASGDVCRTCTPITKIRKNSARPNVCKKTQGPCSCAGNSTSEDVCGPNVGKKSQDPCSCACNSTSEDVCRTCSPLVEVCQNNARPNVCKKPQDPCLSAWNSVLEDVCKTYFPEDDTCPKPSPCSKFGCIELDEAGVCTNVPSIMHHLEDCKKRFLGIIEASLCNIGKDRDPEKIICSTLCAAREKERDRLMFGKTEDSKPCEGTSRFQNEAETLKKFCRNDLLSAAYEKFTACGKVYKPEVCGPCGIENAVACVPNDEDTRLKKCCNNAQGDYNNEEISEFVRIIDRKLREELTQKLKKTICADDSVALKNSYYCVATLCPCMTKNYSLNGPLVLGPFNFAPQEEQVDVCRREADKTESVCSCASTLESFHYSNCIVDADSADTDDSTNSISVCSDGVCTSKIVCKREKPRKKKETCASRCPVVLDHRDSYVYCSDRRAEEHLEAAYSKKSETVAKWGKCHDFVDSVLYERDERMNMYKDLGLDVESPKEPKENTCKRKNGDEEEYLLTHVCGVDERCVPKLQACKREEKENDACTNICSRPSHTCRLRIRQTLPEAVQMVGRIGWLDDSNVQVLYIFPTPQSEELLIILKELIATVRPDIDVEKRLWLIRPEPKCVMKKCVSGSANLFFSPDTYRRVRNLTAGRHAIILSGVMDQKDIFIGCELKIPIMGPPMKFQKRLLNKSHVMELLDVNKVRHPPFLHVHSFGQLCRGMAIMAIQYSIYKTWFVKIDNGFNGHHTGIIRFQKGVLGHAIRNIERTCNIDEDYFCKLLAETLPVQLQLQRSVYKNQKEFFKDLEEYGGIIQACPNDCYDVVSVGIFIEHDLADPVFLTAAEIIHFGGDIRNDMAYFLPQNKLLQNELDELVDSVGRILRNEHVIGYFGIDIVTFRDQFDIQRSWVFDVDPYYTDLIAFSDWVKFCIGPCEQRRGCTGEPKFSNLTELLTKADRHAICCGKLFGTGLSKYCLSTLMSLCKQNQIFYDNKEKMGCMIYPTDSHNRALSIVSINSTRLLTMKKFIEALKALNQLSLRNNGGESFADTTIFSNYLK
ncbi:hypothetical protein KPH14_005818 [Odynerus spinipes]|uniref:IQCH-like ATP-grasp domain-containing protein n=1 Tax=Odynerus spinipes TaxID=1348599 RepID=A0AAD9RB64_9HYME|nr:hypothetical protein KPH14_005818 [Odynerus spinipes]